MHVVYQGPFRPGVILGETGQEARYGEAIEVPDDLGKLLLESGEDWRDPEAKPSRNKKEG